MRRDFDNAPPRGSLAWPAVIALGLGFLVLAVLSAGLAEEGAAANLTREKAVAFAKAQREVNYIYSRSDVIGGNSLIKIEPDALPKDLVKAMVRAIKAQGLTLDEYNALMDVYRSDEHFRSRVVEATLDLM